MKNANLLSVACGREWAIQSKVKLIGTCRGPSHLSGENLEAVYPAELRCQSQEAMLKAEIEEASRMTPPPTRQPENRNKCPANCVCEVTVAEDAGPIRKFFQRSDRLNAVKKS